MRLFFATLVGFTLLMTAADASPIVLPTATGKITSSFGVRKHPILRRSMMHKGLDFQAKLNELLYSVSSGVVKSAGSRGSFGNVVEIYYPDAGASALYAHLNRVKVKAGDRVTPGEPVGLAGSTGRSTGPHLHFEMRSKGTAIDPQKFFAKAAVIQGGLLKSIGKRSVSVQKQPAIASTPASNSAEIPNVLSVNLTSSERNSLRVAAGIDDNGPMLTSEGTMLVRVGKPFFDVFVQVFAVIASAFLSFT